MFESMVGDKQTYDQSQKKYNSLIKSWSPFPPANNNTKTSPTLHNKLLHVGNGRGCGVFDYRYIISLIFGWIEWDCTLHWYKENDQDSHDEPHHIWDDWWVGDKEITKKLLYHMGNNKSFPFPPANYNNTKTSLNPTLYNKLLHIAGLFITIAHCLSSLDHHTSR